MAAEDRYGFFIVDVIMPGINGIELCRKLKQMNPVVPVIILTALGTTDDKLSGFEAGANDYLVKPFEFRELLARIKVQIKMTEQTREPDNKLIKGDLELDLDKKYAKRGKKIIDLTAKEFSLLEFFMRNPGRVLSRNDIAERVWDMSFDSGTNVVDVYVNFLRKKIDKGYNKKLIHTRVGFGYIFGKNSMLIRARLTLQFLLFGGIIIIVASAAIYLFSADFRRDEFRSLLRSRSEDTAKLVLDSYEFNINQIIRSGFSYPTRLQTGKIIILNSENDTLYVSDRKWQFRDINSLIAQVKQKGDISGRQDDYEVIGALHTTRDQQFVVLAAAVDRDGRMHLKKMMTMLLLVSAGSLLLFSIAGWFYSGRALKPISDMVKKVEEISITSLNLRVPEGNGLDEIGRLAITFNRMLERLEKSFATQKDFIANASHELRTPLTSINGQIEVLLMKDRSAPEYKSALESVLEDIRSLIDLSNRLLLIAYQRRNPSEPQD